MNKKFLSAILFGALMVSSTGTFVSCKDYDDDIDRIDNTLNDLKSQIAALESKINEGKWITSVTSSADGVVITMSDGQTYNITNLH
jgi:peptidoglycan hydrolase CwlO-like protein